jgi:hypothetical protein
VTTRERIEDAKRRLGGDLVIDGTTYKAGTPRRVVDLLEHSRRTRERICLRYGDVQTGRDWGDRRMCGQIGRSMGPIKIPLLIATRRSVGGAGLLEHVIVRITNPKTQGVLYSHPKYHR